MELSCEAVTAPPVVDMTRDEQERHAILLLLAMTLVFDNWGVNRRRRERVDAFAAEEPGRTFQDYLGHNVGALLVAPDGAILEFALNRNVALNSTLEHAELRAIRRAIETANARAQPGGIAPWSFGTLLQGCSIYVTLEPCSQCSGIMDLARIAKVVYAAADPGQCGIVHALYHLRDRGGALPAPVPVRAEFFRFWQPLERAYETFLDVTPPGSRRGATSFLETVEAYRIFAAAARAFDRLSGESAAERSLLAAARDFRARRPADPVASLLPG